MFLGCNSLESVELAYYDTSKLDNLEIMFYKCANIKVIKDDKSINNKNF